MPIKIGRSEKVVAPIRGTDVSLQDVLSQSCLNIAAGEPREGDMAALKDDD